MHRFKFTPDDLFINRLKTYPEYNVFIYQGKMHVNRDTRPFGTGGLVVQDINRNHSDISSRVTSFVTSSSEKPVFKNQIYNPLVKNISSDHYKIGAYWSQISGSGKLSSYPTLSGTMLRYRGQADEGSVSPIERSLTTATANHSINYWDLINGTLRSGVGLIPLRTHNVTASALLNVARKYTILSDHFIFTSSSIRSRDLVYDNNDINFIFIPSMYYGSTIKKGSVELNYYITGSKIASCADKNHNGTLIGTTGSTSGSVVGLVMYDEGVIMLTSSVNLETGPPEIRYDGGVTPISSSWIYYGTGLNDTIDSTLSILRLHSASYDLNFKGTSYVNSMTMFAHARKGHLNHSNNPTYRDLTFTRSFTTGSGRTYLEGESPIANVVSASYVSASFEKTTYISKVHIYDEDGNLIAITSMAKPVKKTLNDEFTFKMKLDL